MPRKTRYRLRRPKNAKGRFKRMLGRRFLVRLHMLLIMAAMMGAGLAASKVLLLAGLENMALRYGLVVVSGVAVFLGCVRIWLWYIQTSLVAATSLDAEDAVDAADVALDVADYALEVADAVGEVSSSGTGGDVVAAAVDSADGAEEGIGEGVKTAGEGLLALLEGEEAGAVLFVLAVVLAVFFGVGVFLVWQAPVILAEAAVPAILVAALRRKGREIDHPHWSGSVLKAIWIPATVALVVAVAGGFALQHFCSSATTASQAVHRCVLKD